MTKEDLLEVIAEYAAGFGAILMIFVLGLSAASIISHVEAKGFVLVGVSLIFTDVLFILRRAFSAPST